jgi:hypothetical protein
MQWSLYLRLVFQFFINLPLKTVERGFVGFG